MISATVAPPVEKPVDVFTKSALACLIHLHKATFSLLVSKQVSIMTFNVFLPHAFLIAAI